MKRIVPSKEKTDKYIKECRDAPCFICQIVRGEPLRNEHHILFEDESVIAFLSAFPTQYGQVLVCPKRHVEHVAEELDLDDYLYLQEIVHRMARAVNRFTNPERTYIASFGSQQMNRHVHFHIVPLPANRPIGEQQMTAMIPEVVGHLILDDEDWMALAQGIHDALD